MELLVQICLMRMVFNFKHGSFYFLEHFSENVMAFAWEPTGNKFAVVHGESPRISVSFYNIKPQGGKVEQISK